MTRKALGKGLSALISDKPLRPDADQLQEVSIDLIRPNQFQPRTNFSEKALEELAESIKTNGVIQPIVVRKVGQEYQLIAGERRWRAAQKAGLHKIPAIVRDIPDEKLLELALIENIQRQELNSIEEAKAYQRLLDDLRITQEEVAQRVGKERSSITNYLRLLKLPSEIQRWVEDEKLSMGHARALLAISVKEEQIKLAADIIERGLSVRETERVVKRQSTARESNSAANPTGTTDPNVKAAEQKLSQRLATKVRIHSKGQSGKIEIEFYSADELQRLYSLILGQAH